MNTRKLLLTAMAMVAVPAAFLVASAFATPKSAGTNVQNISIVVLKNDMAVGGNVALAAGVRVRVTITNFTRQFHTFTVPGLHVSVLIRPANGHGPRTTVATFTPRQMGVFAWHCAICPSGIHGRHHAMAGMLYVIVDPSALP